MNLKVRMWFTIIQALLASIATVLLILYVPKIDISIYIYSYIIFLIYLFNFFWGGVSKLVVNGIYATLIILFNMAYPRFFLGIAIAGAFLIIFNPLKPLQNLIARSLKSEVHISLSSLALRQNKVFWEYRKVMKQHFHLDSYAKLFQNRVYAFLRRAVPTLLYICGAFLAIYSLNEDKHRQNFEFMKKAFGVNNYAFTIFMIVSIVCIFIFGYIIYLKSFKSGVRFLTILVIPFITFVIHLLKNIIFKNQTTLYLVVHSGFIIASLVIVIIQIVLYFKRVTYKYYHYFDNDKQEEVFANALYEPFVFDNGYSRVGVFNIAISKYAFQEKFQKVISFANQKYFIITSYVFRDNYVTIYTVFKNSDTAHPRQFLKFLSKIYCCNFITINTFLDEEKLFYPKLFYNNENYIVARTITEAKELLKLGFYKPIILSFFFDFPSENDIINYSQKQPTNTYRTTNNKKLVETRTTVENDETMLEITSRKILLDALMHNAKYLKVSIRYQLETKPYTKYFNE